MKKVLITGANSYIGTSVERWLQKDPEQYLVEVVDTIDGKWKQKDFSVYDVVYHVAGIAHADVGNVSEETKLFYYKINTELAVEVAKKAKEEGIHQFIFMSSMIVYGESAGYGNEKKIQKDTVPSPANFYGDSKWQADKKIQELETELFKVVIVRPPMIYGKGSKGNYPLLSKLATKLPIFPKVKNERSMLYIENLCEFIRLMIDNEESGVFYPQNEKYSETSEIVRMIAKEKEHKIWITSLLNPFVWLASLIPGKVRGLVNKAFGNMTYDLEMSNYDKGNYRVVELEESIKRTEQ